MFIKNIKIRYLDNLIKKYIEISDFKEIHKILAPLFDKDKNQLSILLKSNLFKMLEDEKSSSLFSQNLIWVKSFNLKDTNIINDFLNFYFDNIEFGYFGPKNYADYSLDLLEELKMESDITFDELKNFSYVYQYFISQLNKDKYVILNSDLVFFESEIQRYFTHYYLSKCYFYIVKNPRLVFDDIKSLNPGLDSQIALNLLLNRDEKNTFTYNKNKTHFFENNKQGWGVNVSSWTNANVLSTFRGMAFKLEDIVNKPQEIFTDIIGHLIQHGVKIKLNYQVIDNFIELNSNKIRVNIEPKPLSNKELKLFKRDLGAVSNSFKYLI